MLDPRAKDLYKSSDKDFVRETGKTVDQWVDYLDKRTNLKDGHTIMTQILQDFDKLTESWAHAVAVRYQKEKLYRK